MNFALTEHLTQLTLIFLVGFFAFCEFYMTKRRVWGIIERIEMPSLPFCDLGTRQLEVRLEDGRIIRAQASPCAFCLGRYCVGGEVGVTKLGNKYHVCVSLMPGRRKGSGCHTSGASDKERTCLS